MSTKTFKELREFDAVVSSLFEANPDLKNTKFFHAVKKFNEKNYIPLLKEYRSEIENVQIDNALVDEKTKALSINTESVRGFNYSKEGLKQVIKEEQRVINEFDKKEIEIEPYICKELPEGLTEDQIEVLTGILI